MPDPFDPTSYEQAPPFDPQTLMQGPGQAAPAPAQGQSTKQKLLRLIPLVAAAAKGGPGAIEGLLQGYQIAEQRKQQQATQTAATERQQMLDDRALQQTQFAQRYQVAQLQQKQEADRAALVQEFSKALVDENLTDPEGVRALTQLYESRGRQLGIRPGTFETTAMQMVKPSALETKAARKKVNELRTQFSTKWLEEGAKFTHELPGGKKVSFQQLLSLAGMETDPNAPKVVESETPNTDYARFLARYAKERGKTFDTLTVAEEAAAKKIYGQADDRPPISLTIGPGGMTPQANAVFQQIVSQYQRSPLVQASDRSIVLKNAIKDIEKNPTDPASQLALAYSYIQALDTYQSAVREGELQNLGALGTRLQGFLVQLNKVANEGAFLPHAVALNIAANAKQLAATIEAGKASKEQEFRSRAQVSGVGDAWDQFRAGATGSGSRGPRTAPGDNPFRRTAP